MILSGNQLAKSRCCITPVVFEVMDDSYVHNSEELAGSWLGCWELAGVTGEKREREREGGERQGYGE